MSRTISSTYTTGIVLTSTANNPVKVTGKISVSSGIALEGTPGAAFSWSISNYGTIISNAISPVSTALFLGAYTTSISSGTVVNELTGLISGSGYGVFVNAATGASVTNDFGGTIAGGDFKAIYISGGLGTIVNAGVLQGGNVAIYEYNGGTVTNLSTGTITGNGGVWLQRVGTITNAGTITSTNAGRGAIVFNTTTGSSRLIVDPGAVFNGNIQSLAGSTNGIELASSASAGTLAGFNGTTITNFATLQFDAGAKWTVSGNSLSAGLGSIDITGFAANDTIDLTGFVAVSDTFGTNAVTLTNAATQHATLHIAGTTFSSANFQFASDGSTGTDIYLGTAALGHTLASTITSAITLASPANNPFTITNVGEAAPTAANATALYAPGDAAWTITNAGTVTGGTSLGSGIELGSAGDYVGASTVTNRTGGSIIGAYGIRMYNSAASSVTNQVGATISATELTGVYIGGTSTGTVTNAGVIIAPVGKYAVLIATESTANRVVADPGAVFDGKIGGGDGVMELASAAGAGTLSGFGATITNFSSLQFDTGAAWTVAGNGSASGLGTLDIGGFTIGDTIDLTGFDAVSKNFASNVLVLTDLSSDTETLNIQGAFSTANFKLTSDGSGGTDITDQPPPAVAGAAADQATSGVTPIDPFAGVSISDPNAAQTETVTITQSSTAHGSLSNFGAGIYSDGTYSITGSQGAVSSAIDALVFTPIGHDTAPGGTVATGFTIAVTDTAGGTATNSDTTLDGTVYQEAVAALLPVTEIVHVGDPGTAFISVSNTDADDGFSESLIATLLSVTGNIGIATAGPTGDIVAGASDTSTLGVNFSTALAGTISGTGTIGLTSDGGTGGGSIDGLGTTALADQTVAVNVTVDNFATAELTSGGNLTSNGLGSNAFTLNLGSAIEGNAALSADLNVVNDVAGPADWLSGSLSATGSGQFINAGLGAFGTIDAGGSVDPSVTLATNQLGVFTESILLMPLDTNADDFSEVLPMQTVDVTGTIVPVGTALGDVHMVTYDGLHYDFQAVGAFELTRSTVPGDTFQIQIETAPDAADHAVSYTTEAAAQVGSVVVTFAIDRASTVWVDGAPDTALSAADPVQTLDGGQLREVSAGSYQLSWTSGQTLGISDLGSHLDSSVGLGAANGPGSVQGLLGSDSGQASDFALPDGSVLAQPLSGGELYGAFANAWRVAPGASLLGGGATGGGGGALGAPVGVGAMQAGTMQFIYADAAGAAVGQSVLQADAPGEVLSAAAGVGVLSDAGGFGVTFRGTLAELGDELIAGFSGKDRIDITGFDSANVSTSYAGSASAGVLFLTNGTLSGELYLAGTLAGGSFRVSSDAHGGTEIAFS